MKRACCHPRASRGFGSLIEILIVMAIILGGTAMYMGMSGSSGANDAMRELANEKGTKSVPGYTEPQSIPGKAIRKAVSFECKNNLDQMRKFIMMAKDESQDNNTYPARLEDIPDSIRIRECPVTHQQYTYDPATGQIKCTCPGHEEY